MEAHGVGVEVGTAHQGLPQLSSLVSVTTVSSISDVLCTHDCSAEYCHDHKHYPIFVPPLEGEYIARNILQPVQEAHEAGVGPVDTTSISLACGFAHFTVSLHFSLTYTFLSFRCLGPLPCASADLPLRHFTVVPLSLALPLLTLVPRPLHILYLYYIILVSTLRTSDYFPRE